MENQVPRLVQSVLRVHGISTEGWHPPNKTVSQLCAEIASGEAVLYVSGGELCRKIRTLAINVFCEQGGKIYYLVETGQIFADGSVRKRDLLSSLGEKIKTQDVPDTYQVLRALQEELQITRFQQCVSSGEVIKTSISQSYPGLTTKNILYFFEVFIHPEDFKPGGYLEVQQDKTTYFRWELVED